MPITSSAKKALRQSLRRRARNLEKKEAYKRLVRDVKKFTTAGKQKEAEKLLPRLYQALDKAAKTNAIKKNKAGRLKSRLTAFVRKQGK
ncbi:MAG: 30S ribosomal protein S20 [Candidatus Sungbacteria bacterium]|nr:30S ribosomal protein S20 [Candidatus Sungbacteria bacterium]